MIWVFVLLVIIPTSAVVGALIERRLQIVARLDAVDLEPADTATWDQHVDDAFDVLDGPDPERGWVAPDHGHGPDPRGPGMCRWEVRP